MRVTPVVLVNPEAVETKVLHFVPDGDNCCKVCGLSKHRMRFHYTDEAELWPTLATESRLGMFNPATEMIEPFVACGWTENGDRLQ